MKWLLHKTGISFSDRSDPLTSKAVGDLLRISSIPAPIAVALMAAGLHPTYSELVTAACNGVLGVRVWFEASRTLGVLSGLPEQVVGLWTAEHFGQGYEPVSKSRRLSALPAAPSCIEALPPDAWLV